MRVGLVSDTHGYLDERVTTLLHGVGLILHAGDVGTLAVLDGLEAIAPVRAVRGNNDEGRETGDLPLTIDLELGGLKIHVVHILDRRNPPAANIVVFGHSHRMLLEERAGTVLVNPGAAGRQGFHSVVSAALLEVIDGRAEVRLAELGPRSRPARAAAAAGSR
ncbi:MAG: YfcE family phosphodiesterase [Dehalococcoidia bacterium]|nr:YfcE family phosphodiesterase [Dehalococcoidia bacterium]